MSGQTKTMSVVEAFTNILIGLSINIPGQIIIFKILGIPVPISDNLWIAAWFTGIALIKLYLVRRYFNSRQQENMLPDG